MTRQTKDSGVEWIGEIPSNWNTARMKSCITQRDSGAWGDEATGEPGDIICLRVADFDYSAFKFKDTPIEELTYRHYTDDTIKKLSLKKNDILIEKSGGGEKTPVGRTVIFDKTYPALFANFMDRLKTSGFVAPEFMQYVFVTFYKNNYTRNYIKQTTGIQNLDLTTMLASESIPFPSLEEQKRIVDFLDEKCSEIDAVISKTKNTIEEYKKLKQSIITEAVTKGIRGDRPMKDSGIEWIGEMPDEWNLIPFRHVLKERQEKNSPIKSTERLSLSIELGVTLYADKTTNLDRFKEDFEQYKLAHSGDLVMNSMNMIVGATGVSDYYGCVSPVYYTFYDELDDHATAKFCEYIFRSKTMLRFLFSLGKGIYAIVRGDDRVNTCRLKVSKEDLKSIVIPIPSVDEQREIIVYLQNKCTEIDSLIAKKTALLEEMESYKKSVIYEYVTGKKECETIKEAETVATIYPYFPAVLSTNKARFAQAILMSRILDKCRIKMGRVKLEKMLYTIECSIGFDFDTEYARESAGPLDGSIYKCEGIISRQNNWYKLKSSQYGVSYTPTKDSGKYKKYYDTYFANYDSEIERIIGIFMDYNADQAEIVATLFAAWNDFIIDQKRFTDEELVDEVLNNWNDSKKRFPRDVWLRAIKNMRQNNLVPKGYGKHTIIKEVEV